MESIERREQTPEDSQKGHRSRVVKQYDIPNLCKILNISETQALYSSKKLPKGWKRTDVFPVKKQANSLVQEALSEIKNASLTTEEIQHLYAVVIGHDGVDSNSACLFIRYTRNRYFKK